MKLSRPLIYTHIVIAFLVAIVLYAVFKPLVAVSPTILFADVISSGVILAILLLLLQLATQYMHLSELNPKQRLINQGSLGILFVFCWLAVGLGGLSLWVEKDDLEILYQTIPLRVVLGVLIYSLALLIFSKAKHDSRQTLLDENIEESINEEAETHEEKEEIIERLAVKSGQRIEVIALAEILLIQAEGDYVMIHTVRGKFLKEQTMKALNSTLPAEQFVRVHRSSIVNIDFISQIELYNKQTQLLKLKNGIQVRASVAGYRLLKETLKL